MKPWRRVETERVLRCGIFEMDRVCYQPPDGGEARSYYVIEAPDWINVIPITDGGDVLMVRQFRVGIAEPTLEIPGGMCDGDEPPQRAAIRELHEETGYTAATLDPLGWVHPNPPIQNNRCHTFLARGLSRAGTPRPDADERIEVISVPLEQIPDLIRDRRITHALVLAAFHLYEKVEPVSS